MDFELSLPTVKTQMERKKLPYEVRQTIGRGSFGTVVKAHDIRTKEVVAIKFVHASKMHDYLCTEVQNHRILRHPHVIGFHRVLEVGGHLAIIMEYADGSSLFRLVKLNRRLSEPLARWIFQQLILAVDYCHRKGVASRDIKCENVLLVKGHRLPIVKLSDFGYSKSTSPKEGAKSVVGSVDYMAPEVISKDDTSTYDAMKADIWSCGVVLYVMLAGHYPFTRKHIPRTNVAGRATVRKKVVALDYKLPEQLSGEACSLIRSILTLPQDRISLSQIMEHPWFVRHFPDGAQTMNTELLEEERKRNCIPPIIDWQTDEEVENEIMRAGWFDKAKRQREYVSDSLIDEEIDEDIRKHSKHESLATEREDTNEGLL